ncbi:MAG: chorismate mutase [Chloroflexi bacterium]|nr:chorismate mutase [Chloroflexota bacterium]
MGATMYVRGIRGATTAEENTRSAIIEATRELLARMVQANEVDVEDIASIIFTASPDVNAEFPAVAARVMGATAGNSWENLALICTHEMGVPDGLARCIRVLLHVNTTKRLNEIVHVYLRGAQGLREARLRTAREALASVSPAGSPQPDHR